MTQMSKHTKPFVLSLVTLSLVLATTVSLFLFHMTTRAAGSSYRVSWVGTSSQMSGANNQWVQDFVNAAVVQPDGTIWTISGWDEAHHEYGDYKNGQVVGDNLWENRHNLNNNSSRSVQDSAGRTWTIQNATYVGGDRVCRNGSSVCIGPMNGFRPNALAIANDGSLMVGDNGPDQQIKFFNISGNSNNQISTIGEKGGAWAGPEPGRTGALRFHGIWGTGMDSSGNIYVIGNFPGGGTWMRSLQANGTLNWQRYGKMFVSNAIPDMSTDGVNVYDHNALYKLDYSQTQAGKEVQGDFPYAVTVDPWSHPDDPRLGVYWNNGSDQHAQDTQGDVSAHYNFMFYVPRWLHHCYGRTYLFTTGMFGGAVGSYRQEGNFWVAKSYNNGPSGDWPWASYVDSNCDIWLSSYDGNVSRYPATGVDGSGNLTYGNAISFPRITDFNDVMRIQYDRSTNELYVSGFTDSRPREYGWGEAGSTLKRYSSWTGSRQTTLNINFPYDMAGDADHQDGENSYWIQEWDISGDYIFAIFGSRSDLSSEHISPTIYAKSNGSRVDNLGTKSPIAFNDIGWVDVRGLTTGKRSNGEYLLFVEEDWKNKSLLFRWCPTGTCSGGTTPTPTPTPSPSGGSNYEAENATLNGDAGSYSCSSCSGGSAVGWVGSGSSVTFTNVQAATAGSYQLTFYYATDTNRTVQLSINNGSATTVSLPGTGSWETFGSATVTVNLKAGTNTIRYSAGSGDAPDLDRIRV